MEIRKRLNLRLIFTVVYLVCLFTYIIIAIAPADAKTYEISGRLEIPAINLVSDVTTLSLEQNELKTPDTIVGSYSRSSLKTFLVGHRSTVFKDLAAVRPGDLIHYDGASYRISKMSVEAKDSINMSKLLFPVEGEEETLILMTCAGKSLENLDASHRLIVTAYKITN